MLSRRYYQKIKTFNRKENTKFNLNNNKCNNIGNGNTNSNMQMQVRG